MQGHGTVSVALLLVAVGCQERPAVDMANWSKPEELSMTLDGIGSSFSSYKWNGSLLAMNNDAGPFSVYLLQPNGRTWKTSVSSPGDWLPLDADPLANRLVVSKGLRYGQLLSVTFCIGALDPLQSLTITGRYNLQADKSAFFGTADTNVYFESWTKNGPVPETYWGGAFSGSEIYIPYCILGDTLIDGALVGAAGPFNNGVFVSSNSGRTWKWENIDSTFSESPQVCRTEEFYYFTAGRTDTDELWFSRKDVKDGTWSAPAVVTDHYATWNCAVADGDTIHACWLDRRHERRRVNPFNPWKKNYEVAYCHRKDAEMLRTYF